MKKRKAKIKHHNNINKNNQVFFKENILNSPSFLILVTLLAFALIFSVTNIVSNQEPSLSPGEISKNTPYQDMKLWFSENIAFDGESSTLPKFLIFLLVTLIVFSIIGFVPIFSDSHQFIQFSISVIVGILSTLWLVPEEVFTILTTYSALGIVLTTFFPLVILMAFTIKLNTADPRYSVISKFMWVAFIVIISFKYFVPFYTWLTTGNSSSSGTFGFIAYIITLVVGLIMIFFDKPLLRLLFKEHLKSLEEDSRRDLALSLEGEADRREREKPRGLFGGIEVAYDKKTKDLRKRAKKILNSLP